MVCRRVFTPRALLEIIVHTKLLFSDHIFFFAYLQPPPKEGGGIWSAADELTAVNSKLNRTKRGQLKPEMG